MTGCFGHELECLCIVGIVLCGAAACLAAAWDAVRAVLSSEGVKGCLVLAMVALLVQYAATKPKVTYTDGLVDAGHTLVTNDTVHVEWLRDVKAKWLVPLTAPVFIDYRPHGSTNQWGMLSQSVVSANFWDGVLANATNYDYHVWAYYVPPGPVVTNEYWTYSTVLDPDRKAAVPLRSRVEVNGKAISPKEGECNE